MEDTLREFLDYWLVISEVIIEWRNPLMILGSIAVVFLLYIWFLVSFYARVVKPLFDFDGPPTNLFLGNAWDLRNNTEVMHVFHRYTKEYGKMCRIRIGFEYLIIATDCKFLEYLLTSHRFLNKGKIYKFLSRWLGTGLLTADAPKWKKHRRIIAPAFYVPILETFVSVFNAQTDKLISKLHQNEMGKPGFDIFPYITLCTLDMICETAIGTSLKCQDDATGRYAQSVKTICTIILERASSPFLAFDWIYKLTKRYQEEKRALELLHWVTNCVIEKKTEELNHVPTTRDPWGTEIGPTKKLAFLDLLLWYNQTSKEPMSAKDLREEVDTFMFAGHDTTAAAISFALYSIAQYPEVQTNILEELEVIFYDDFYRAPTQNDLLRMKYLENVIKETMRLYPPVPFYLRNLDEDLYYEDKLIPKGTSIMIFAYGVHRSPELYTDPEKFDPDRFNDTSSRNAYAYLPFSAGPRNCIGQKFAMLEMKATISKIVKAFELHPASPEHNLRISGETVLRAVNGLQICLKERKYVPKDNKKQAEGETAEEVKLNKAKNSEVSPKNEGNKDGTLKEVQEDVYDGFQEEAAPYEKAEEEWEVYETTKEEEEANGERKEFSGHMGWELQMSLRNISNKLLSGGTLDLRVIGGTEESASDSSNGSMDENVAIDDRTNLIKEGEFKVTANTWATKKRTPDVKGAQDRKSTNENFGHLSTTFEEIEEHASRKNVRS